MNIARRSGDETLVDTLPKDPYRFPPSARVEKMMNSFKKGLLASFAVAISGSLLYADTEPAPAPKLLTADEISKKSTELKTQMDQDLVHVGRLQAKARKDKDVIKLNCVNDKMVQIKAMLNLADDNRAQITDALTLGNGRAPELFSTFSRSASDVKKLREDADVCVGVGPDYVGNSKLNVSNPAMPDDPTAGNPFDDHIEAPAYASPYS
jgi:hypothetical protein